MGFMGVLEANKAKAGLGFLQSQEKLLMKRWLIADATEAGSNRSLSEEYKTFSWQFLHSGGFVVFEEQLIGETGEWSLRGQELRIRKEGQEEPESYVIKKLTQRELLLSSAAVKIRLLKFDE